MSVLFFGNAPPLLHWFLLLSPFLSALRKLFYLPGGPAVGAAGKMELHRRLSELLATDVASMIKVGIPLR